MGYAYRQSLSLRNIVFRTLCLLLLSGGCNAQPIELSGHYEKASTFGDAASGGGTRPVPLPGRVNDRLAVTEASAEPKIGNNMAQGQPVSVTAREAGHAAPAAEEEKAYLESIARDAKLKVQQETEAEISQLKADIARLKAEREARLNAEKQADKPAGREAKAEASASKTQVDSPEILVERWMKDWAAKNVEGYLSHYDIGFHPADGKDRKAWEAKRRRRIDEASSIKVRAEKLKIERLGELTAIARFTEIIEVGGYKKATWKKLSIIRKDKDSEWKIREENELIKAETDAQAVEVKAAKPKVEQKTKTREEQRTAEQDKQAAQDEAARPQLEAKTEEQAKLAAQAKAEAARVKAEQKAKAKPDAEAAKLKTAQDAKVTLAAVPQAGEQAGGVDWSDRHFWLVEMTGVYDRSAVAAVWRDLRARFPKQMENRTILPRRSDAGGESDSRYRLFIAKFSEQQAAEEFCAMLRAGQQHCGVVSSQALAGKDGLNTPSTTGKDGKDAQRNQP